MDDSSDKSEPEGSQFPYRRWLAQFLLIAVGAIIAGVFSVAPKLYDIATAPRAALSYREVSGPAISTSAGFRQIFSFTVQNGGKLPLTTVELEVRLPADSEIESTALEQSGGLSPTTTSVVNIYHTEIRRLLPTESFSVSIMVISKTPTNVPSVILRSNEVLGNEESEKVNNVPFEVVTSALLAAASVATALGIALSILTQNKYRRVIGQVIGTGTSDKELIIRYICILSGVLDIDLKMNFDNRLTYIGVGDALLYAALSDMEKRSKCVIALKALLASGFRIAPESVASIRMNLENIGYVISDDELSSLRAQTRSGETTSQVRKRIALFFRNNAP